jgi:hypothetical protein
MRVETLEHARPVGRGEPPDPPEERPVDAIGDARLLVDRATMAKAPPRDRQEARAAREVEEDGGVRAREPRVEAAEPHRVQDPRITRDDVRLETAPLVALGARVVDAAEQVAVRDLDPEPRTELVRQSRLPRSAAAEDGDAPHRS